MAEPDRTNADAERVSDIVAKLRKAAEVVRIAVSPSYGASLGELAVEAADIIEAQSKALAEAREALLVADEHLTGIENYGGEPAVRARRGRAAINAALGGRS